MEVFGHQVRFAIDTLRAALKKQRGNPGPLVGMQIKCAKEAIKAKREGKDDKTDLPGSC